MTVSFSASKGEGNINLEDSKLLQNNKNITNAYFENISSNLKIFENNRS